MTVNAFIFDLDGVICETSKHHMEAWKYLANNLGLEFNESINEKLKGISRMESLGIILKYNSVVYSETKKQNLLAIKNNYYQQLIESITENDYLPGIKDLLLTIRNKNIKIALASASHNAPTILKKLNGEIYFDYIVNPSQIKNGKPAPDIFLSAANYFKVNPSTCIGVEDAVSGIEAINAAKMFSVGIGNKNILNKANLCFSSTKVMTFEKIIKAFYR